MRYLSPLVLLALLVLSSATTASAQESCSGITEAPSLPGYLTECDAMGGSITPSSDGTMAAMAARSMRRAPGTVSAEWRFPGTYDGEINSVCAYYSVHDLRIGRRGTLTITITVTYTDPVSGIPAETSNTVAITAERDAIGICVTVPILIAADVTWRVRATLTARTGAVSATVTVGDVVHDGLPFRL